MVAIYVSVNLYLQLGIHGTDTAERYGLKVQKCIRRVQASWLFDSDVAAFAFAEVTLRKMLY